MTEFSSTETTEMENDVFQHQEFGQRLGFGKSPALMLVDFTVGFCDPNVFGGGNIEEASRQASLLLGFFRQRNLPVVHTKILYEEDGSDANLHTLKVPRLTTLTESNPHSEFAADVMPIRGEIIVRKQLPSAFFGTSLTGILAARGIDTLVIGGCTTSGCVRASALDAICNGFRPMVIKDCVGDRSMSSHKASLFDLDKKYADVMSMDAVMTALENHRHYESGI